MTIDSPHPPPGRTVSPPSSPFDEATADAAAPAAGRQGASPMAAPPASADVEEVADAIAAAALGVPGVVRLHSGTFGEVGTYLPGRRVAGVKTGDQVTEVHLVLARDVPVLGVAQAVRQAVLPLVTTPVDVFVEDLDSPTTP